MRRQVKPFVTEYRGAVRRHKDQSGSIDQPQEPPAARPRPMSDAQRLFGSDAPDTSYEAALRAADALFSTSPATRKATVPAAMQPPSEQPDPWAKLPAKASPPRADDAQPSAVPAEARVDRSDDDDKGAASNRRILQAIEPPEDDRFAALEAERAPKRRGRKPGSKNKPKPIVVDDWDASARGATQFAGGGAPEGSRTVSAPLDALWIEDEAQVSFAVEEEAGTASLPIDDLPIAAGRARNDRFGWKRAGLRPGERWKRRLPKAAW